MQKLHFSKKHAAHFLFFFIAFLCKLTGFTQDASIKNAMVVNYVGSRFPDNITTVIVDKNNVTMKGSIARSAGALYICELRMFNDTKLSDNSFASATPINASGSNFQVQMKRFANGDNETYDRLYSRWVVCLKQGNNYKAQSYAHYADDINGAAVQYLPEEKPAGKKGLEGFFQESRESDLTDLGLNNVTVNITLPQVISLDSTQYSYKFDGKTYFMNAKTVEHYDRAFKLCSDKNIFVTAIILIQQNVPANIKSILVHPNANGGVESMANLTSQQGFDYYAAIISFLAERYSRPDKQYGRIQNWIVHNEVDNGVFWTNAGNAKMESYTEFYDRSMRTVYYSVRQYNPAAKVFISLTHAWAVAPQPTFYAPKYMLGLFNNLSIKQGDYEWGVAFHPYPEDITNPTPWSDKDATMDINSTHIITPRNIELIDAWMRMPDHLYKGQKVRTLLFSEEGANSKSNSQQDMLQQAAVIAYMWKKFTRLPSAEAFDYHAQCDNRNEKLKFGLYTPKQGTIATPDQKKTSWYVYQKAGTPSEDSAFAFALPVIGVTNWSQTFNQLSDQNMPYTVAFNVSGSSANDVSIYFNGEMHKPINGKAIFYNVAGNLQSRTYTIQRNGSTINTGNIRVTKNQSVSVNVQ